ncbi:MAG TPA: hypothetical protein VMZ74_04230 [Ramlibacter sp.]|nr:hypothetical protein [Ramlibacter sp.]
MTGIYNDNNPKSGQPPPVLGAWIQDQLAELRDGPLRRLANLRAQLQSTAFEWDATVLAQTVGNLRSAGRELRFDSLKHGWLARRMGKHKPAYTRFAGARERIVDAAQKVKAETARLAGTLKTHTAAVKRLLVDLGMEAQSVQAEVDQGVTWLQDMCVQINEQRERGSAEAQLATLAEAAQAFTQEFKRLQLASSMARELGLRMQGVVDRRNALVEGVRVDMEKFDKNWMRAVGKVAAEVEEGRTAFPGLNDAAQAHEDLLGRLENSAEAGTALQHEEHLLAQQLDMLRRELEPAR